MSFNNAFSQWEKKMNPLIPFEPTNTRKKIQNMLKSVSLKKLKILRDTLKMQGFYGDKTLEKQFFVGPKQPKLGDGRKSPSTVVSVNS